MKKLKMKKLLIGMWLIWVWVIPDCRSQVKLNTFTLTCSDSINQATQTSIGLFDALTGSFQQMDKLTLKGTTPITASFRLATPQFAYLRYGDELHPLYVQPGEQLRLHLDLTGKEITLTFAGQGSEANSYLAKTYLIQRQFEKGLFALLLPESFQRLDSLENALHLVDQTYIQRNRITRNVLAILRKRGHIRILSLKLNILLSQYSGGQDTTVRVPMSQAAQQVPFDATLLATHLPDYARLLYFYRTALLMLNLSATFTKEEMTYHRPRLPLITDETIKKWSLKPVFTEFMRADNLNGRIGQQGIIPATTAVLTNYRKQYPNSVYLAELQKSYDRWLILKAGQKAPDFTGTTPDGKRISLTDLKGKVVYMDVWATWCQPCQAEFPFAKQLQQAFSTTDQVVFLYVSIDKNLNVWKKVVRADATPIGYHINMFDQKQSNQFSKSYIANSVPRYLLIDKQGNIVNSEAPKPSSKGIEKAIKDLLN